MSRRFVRSLQAAPVLRGLAAATAILLVAGTADAQYVNLQSTSPGTPQTGNANVTGTILAGKFAAGTFSSPDYVISAQSNGVAIFGNSANTHGVEGWSSSATGWGVYGWGTYPGAGGVQGVGTIGVQGGGGQTGVYGWSDYPTGIGVYGAAHNHGTGVTAYSNGGYSLFCVGNFGATGAKNFVIDHPLDPANKTLKHYCAEGAEPLNVYSGNVTTDCSGYATVTLPDWIESINRDFRYQLTVVDDGNSDEFVQAKVVRRIAGHRFTIRTSVGNVDVSWQLTGARDDAWMRAHPTVVEEDKPADQRGKFWSPELYGASLEQSMIPMVASTPTSPTPPDDLDTQRRDAPAGTPEASPSRSANATGEANDAHDLQPIRTPVIRR